MMIKHWKEKKIVHSSIVRMMVYVNILSIVILSLFNYYVFHQSSRDAYRQNLVEHNQRVNGLALDNIDRQILEPVLKISQTYFSVFNVNSAALRPQTEPIIGSAEAIRQLTDLMDNIRNTYPSVESMDIYYEGTGTVVTGFDKVHSDSRGVDTFLPWYQQFVDGGRQEGFLFMPEGPYTQKRPVLTYIRPVSNHLWNGKEIVLAFHIPVSGFSEYIDTEGGVLALIKEDGTVLYSTDEMVGNVFAANQAQMESEQKIDTGGEVLRYTVFYRDSVIRGIQYAYGVDNTLFYHDFYKNEGMFRLNFIISIAFNLLMLMMISRYNYTAYRKRVEDISESAGISLEPEKLSFDDSIHALASEINKLHHVVDSSKDMVFQSAVRSMLFSKNTEKNRQQLEPYLRGEWACVCVISLTDQDAEELSVEKLQADWQPEESICRTMFTLMEKTSLVAVLVFDGDRKDEVRSRFEAEIHRMWKNCQMAFGRCLKNQKENIRVSFESALEAEEYFFILPEQKLLSWENLGIEKRKNSGSHLQLFESIERDMKREDLLGVKNRLDGLVASFQLGNYSIGYCKSTLRDLVTLFSQMMQQHSIDMWVVFGYDIRDYYKKIPDISQFGVWIAGVAEVILMNLHQRRESVDVDVREEIIRILEQSEESELTLDFLAASLHMRTDAASRIFRQVMGKGYTEYIRERKMKTAVELLEQDVTVKEIAERIGYSSAQYFIRVFKEEYGVTPYQYKKRQKEGKE